MSKKKGDLIFKHKKPIGFKRLEEFSDIDASKLETDTHLWESGKLGASAKHAKPVSDKQAQALDDTLGLQLLSFRVQKSLIKRLKELAKFEGIGYQPLMRQILTRYVRAQERKLQETQRRNKSIARTKYS